MDAIEDKPLLKRRRLRTTRKKPCGLYRTRAGKHKDGKRHSNLNGPTRSGGHAVQIGGSGLDAQASAVRIDLNNQPKNRLRFSAARADGMRTSFIALAPADQERPCAGSLTQTMLAGEPLLGAWASRTGLVVGRKTTNELLLWSFVERKGII